MDLATHTLQCTDEGLTLEMSTGTSESKFSQSSVLLVDTIRIPPSSELEVMAQVPETMVNGCYLMEPITSRRVPIRAARALISPAAGRAPARLLNPGTEAITIHKGTKIATLESVANLTISAVNTQGQSDPPSDGADKASPGKQALLWQMVQDSEGQLTDSQATELHTLLLSYADVFAENETDLGHTDVTQHRIDTGEAKPIRQPPRRVPAAYRQENQKLLQDMLKRNIVQPSTSPWAAPVVLIRKKNGTLRFCVDYRKLNAVTRKDAYPLPRVDDALDTLAGSCWFTTLDMISGYWQVELHPDDKPKSAFATPDGLFEFNVLPFGLCNGPATFQRLMDSVLAGLQWSSCLVYVDDVIIPGKTFEEHLCNLGNVLGRLRTANLKLQPAKCALVRKKVEFLGHIVSAEGIAPDPKKISKVATWPIPTCKRDVQQFLGLANYYRRFIKNFADVARPLHRLTEKTYTFAWSEECQSAFEELRRLLTSAPILAFPDLSEPFVLDTDASGTGIGAVLSQVRKGRECVVAYASRILSKPERRYCTTRRELLAVVCFVRHFRPYLLGTSFTVRTDHGSLKWLYSFKQPEGQLARWLEQLQEYNFQVVHRQGKQHGNADALSRRPCQQCGRDCLGGIPCEDPASIPDCSTAGLPTANQAAIVDIPDHITNHTPPKGKEATQVAVLGHNSQDPSDCQPQVDDTSEDPTYQAQLDDPDIGPVLKAKQEATRPTPGQSTFWGRECNILLQQWDQLEIHDNLLCRRFHHRDGSRSHLQLVVPVRLRRQILQDLHAGAVSGHLGQRKTLSQLRLRFYWPGQTTDVRTWCRTCSVCSARKTPSPKQCANLHTIGAGYPMQVVAVDILGPLPESPSGNKYILVAVDYFTRWAEAYGIPNQEAVTVANKLVNEMFLRFSPPTQLHSDQGRQFESSLMAEVCKLFGIQKSRTTAYHPQGDGLAERYNRTLLSMLATCAHQHPQSWELHLQKVLRVQFE